MKNTVKKLISLIVVFTIAFCYAIVFVGCETTSTRDYDLPSINDNFHIGEVYVGLTAEYSEVNKPIVKEDFTTDKMIWQEDIAEDKLESALKRYVVIDYIKDRTYTEHPENSMYPSFCQMLCVYLVNEDKQSVIDAVKELYKLEHVKYAVPNYIYEVCEDSYTPNDEYYDNQWCLTDANGICYESVMDFIDEDMDANIKIGIFENNVQLDHPDLCVEYGNFTPSSTTNKNHGTFVSGIIGGKINNTIGITGIASAEIYLLNRSTFADSLLWAYENGIRVVNASFHYVDLLKEPAGPNTDHAEALELFSDHGGVFVAAAGNRTADSDEKANYPAGYADKRYYPNIDNIISVGAITASGERSSFSNYGENSVSIYAPGSNILSTFPESNYETNVTGYTQVSCGYAYGNGTSFSAPLVTGALALLLSIKPNLTVTQLVRSIINSADNITITIPTETTQTVKKLNLFKALKYVINNYGSSTVVKYNQKTISRTIDADSAYYLDNHAIIKVTVANNFTYNFEITSNNAINVSLYDNNLNLMSQTGVFSNNRCGYEFSKALSSNTYYLKVTYVDTETSGTITANICGTGHNHDYDDWKYYSSTQHIELCTSCGEVGTMLGAHWALDSDIVNNKANCRGCGFLIDLRNNPIIGQLGLTRVLVTNNGSYVLSNGIVILVDEDVESYLDGTLIFYNVDELPIAA